MVTVGGRLPRLPFPPSPLTVWAVEDTAAQLAWGALPAGPIAVEAAIDGETVGSASLDHPGGPGVLVVSGLQPARQHDIVVHTTSGTERLSATTLSAMPGPERCRIATISDLHLGSDHFGAAKQMREFPERAEPFAFRSAVAAIRSAIEWGATHLIIKGDAAHHGRQPDFAELGRLVDLFPDLPMSLLPGNHDTDEREMELPDTVGERALPFERDVSHLDLPGLRVVLGDTTIAGEGPGTLERVGDALVTAASEAAGGALVAVHQQLQTDDPNRYWPPGIPSKESTPFLDRLDGAAPGAVVTSGHTHRNRARRHGSLLVTEVAATHHWPGVWAGYAVHDAGIRQVVRRIGHDVIEWHEYSKNAVGSLWQRYATGRLDQRCIVHEWSDN